MTCKECQLEIFGRESLEGTPAASLTPDACAHFATCDDCQALEQEVRLNLAALAELRDEPLPAPAPSSAGPVISLPAPRQRHWSAYGAWSAAAAAVLLVGFFALRDSRSGVDVATSQPRVSGTPSDLVPLASAPPAPVGPVAPVRKEKEQLAVARPRPRRSAPARPALVKALPESAPAQPPTLIKIVTDDPNVVIYWPVDPIQGDQAL